MIYLNLKQVHPPNFKLKSFDFFEKVYEVIKKIPYGRVTSYSAIAHFLGTKKSARLVGYALKHSHSHSNNLPAYRVVNHKGILTGKNNFTHPLYMQKKLESEGILIKDDKILNFNEVFWHPSEQLI